MEDVIIGSSGFKYTEIIDSYINKWGMSTIISRTCIIKNKVTNIELFRLTGKQGQWQGRGTRATKQPDSTAADKFLGLDNRYYYISVSYKKIEWGQIQSSGAVLRENRTILTNLDFYPMNIITPTVPVVNIASEIPVTSTVSVTPVNSVEWLEVPDTPPIIKSELVIPQVKEITWIEQIKNQIILLIQKIINLLSPKT